MSRLFAVDNDLKLTPALSAFQRPAFIEKPSTFSPMAAPSDTNADGSISQAANDIPMPDISTSPLNETVQHNEDETLFHMSDLTSVPSLSRDPTPAPPCVDLEVPTKYRWMKIALSHITSLMKENHGTEISYLWASIEKGLGYPSGAVRSIECIVNASRNSYTVPCRVIRLNSIYRRCQGSYKTGSSNSLPSLMSSPASKPMISIPT